jgi:uncharacterized membrane protein
MTILILGVLLWALVHLMPALQPAVKKRLVDGLGAGAYRGVFTLAILASLVLIVTGWRSTPEDYLYVLPPWSRAAALLLIVVAFILIGAANYPTRIKLYIRHPMLLGVFFWSVGHLLTNGTTRALVLFGLLGAWSLIEMPLINRREGAFVKPALPPFRGELKGVFISAAIFLVVLLLHPYFTGVTPFP